MSIKGEEWDRSYRNKDNYLFYPHEEVIRFISKYIRKKVGRNEFIEQSAYNSSLKILDVGCGIGRHVKLANEFSLDAYGFDLSIEAVEMAKSFFDSSKQHKALSEKIITADITSLPYQNEEFDFMISHGVLDSMPFAVAKKGMVELHRVLKKGGLIYLDLIGASDSSFENTSSFEKVVDDNHENGTIQSYFNVDRIDQLLGKYYQIIELYQIERKDFLYKDSVVSRYHLIIKKG